MNIIKSDAFKLVIFFTFTVIFIVSSNQNLHSQETSFKDIKPIDKGYNLYPDEYTELDDPSAPNGKDDTYIVNTLERSRQNYLRALTFIERNDTTKAARYFEKLQP